MYYYMFSKGFDTKKILYEKLLSMCAMHVYVHLKSMSLKTHANQCETQPTRS
jgi:hypothetical protein